MSVYTTSSSPLLLFKAAMMPSWVLCTHMLYINSLYMFSCCCCCSVVSNSLWSHGLQHTRLPGPSPSPGACSNSCPLSQWCHPTILSSVIPFSSYLQSFPAPGSLPTSQFFTSGGQSIGASTSILPMNIQGWFPLGLTVWSSCHPRDSQESSPVLQLKSINSLVLSLLYNLTHFHT